MRDVLLVGCGNMGGALLSGWLDAGLLRHGFVVDPAASTITGSVIFVADACKLPPDFTPDMVVLATKPQTMGTLLPVYAKFSGSAPFLSIAAGKTLAFLETHLGSRTRIVRAMPNLPATVRRGTSAACGNEYATMADRDLAGQLLGSVGSVHWVNESEIDAVTALSGSGPAYVFLLAETLGRAGESLGLDPSLSASLARETLAGASEMLRQSPEAAETLRARVTSKGGTTEAALRILMENDGLFSIYASALQAAVSRARELAD